MMHSNPTGRVAIAVATMLMGIMVTASAQLPEQFSAPQAPPGPQPATVRDGLAIAAGGDLLGNFLPRMGMEDPQLAPVVELMRGADATFANLESMLFDIADFKGYPAAETGGFEQGGVGGGPLFPAAVAADLKAMGISMVSVANNHSLDWGHEGLLATMRHLDEAGIVHAGGGAGLAQARRAAFQQTAGGRVALVAAASTYLPMSPAGPGRGDRAQRPGISTLRNQPVVMVTADELDVLRDIATRTGQPPENAEEAIIQPNFAFYSGQKFRLGDSKQVTYDVNENDRKEILEAIRAGKKSADAAVFAIHTHETATGGQEHLTPNGQLDSPEFLRKLHRDAIDSGADMAITHGPHALRGVEIYKGRPIFYSLGSLFFSVGANWPDDWYESVLAITRFSGGAVAEIRLYPLRIRTAGDATQRSHAGAPRLAKGAEAQRILKALQDSSSQYGTRIVIEKDVGIIRVSGS